MPLTITIPRSLPPPPLSSAKEDMENSNLVKSQRNRKLPKRFMDEESEPNRKAARTSTSGKGKKIALEPPPETVDSIFSPNAEVDVVMDDTSVAPQKDVENYHSENSIERNAASRKGQPKATKSKSKPQASAPPPARKRVQKRNVVVSDSEEEDDYMDATLDVVAEDEDEEDYYSPEEKPSKPSKAKGKASSAKPTAGKRKAKTEPSETGHSGTDKKVGSLFAPKKKAKLPPPKHEDVILDVVGESIPEGPSNVERTSPVTSKQDSPIPAIIPKKPKLPTIKKTKLPAGSAINTPVSASSSTSKLPLELGLNNKLNHDGIRKTMINKTDVDLSNKSVYEEIFLKMAGEGGTPRRTKEEERRKELNKMRDEFKAKKLEETRHTFDLQAQHDKISRFEDKLKAARSSALWPNFLGAKWREEHEREKREQKELQWKAGPREDGEVH